MGSHIVGNTLYMSEPLYSPVLDSLIAEMEAHAKPKGWTLRDECDYRLYRIALLFRPS